MAATDAPPRSAFGAPPQGGAAGGPAKPGHGGRLGVVRWVRRVWQLFAALFALPATAAVLPEDRAEGLYHVYDGGGVKASGPALLVRKSLADKVSLSAQYYVDAVSNASIDVVTTASPFKETRKAWTLGGDWLVRDTLLSVSADKSTEPDYVASTVSVDVAHDTFGGMTTVGLGFTRGRDDVGRKDIGFFDRATHWQYRAGVTQILSPRWLASLNYEAVEDEGYLGSPYRAAMVFGTLVHENVPRTRSSRAVRLRATGDVGGEGQRLAVRADWRHYWDNWDIKADTFEVGAARYFGGGGRWLADASLRWHRQGKAQFYADNAAQQATFVSRNRQLSTFRTLGIGAKVTYAFEGPWAVKLSGGYERKQFRFSDFTDMRTGKLYSYDANVLQVFVNASF